MTIALLWSSIVLNIILFFMYRNERVLHFRYRELLRMLLNREKK